MLSLSLYLLLLTTLFILLVSYHSILCTHHLNRAEDATVLTEALSEQAINELVETVFAEADHDGDGRYAPRGLPWTEGYVSV